VPQGQSDQGATPTKRRTEQENPSGLPCRGARSRGPHESIHVNGYPGSRGGYWARTVDVEDLVQHSFRLFDGDEGARAAEATYQTLREMPDAPATFMSVEVCEVVGQA
jgi:hypothetical protein